MARIDLIAEKKLNLSAVIDAAGLAHGKGMRSYLVLMAVLLLTWRQGHCRTVECKPEYRV